MQIFTPHFWNIKPTRLLLIFFSFFVSLAMYSQRLQDAVSLDDAEKSVQKDFQGFRENKGQITDDKGNPAPYVLFRTNIGSADLFITNKGITYVFNRWFDDYANMNEDEKTAYELKKTAGAESNSLERYRVDMDLQGANISSANIITEDPVENGNVNYFLAHCPNGIFDVNAYKKVTITNIYPGIDWVLHYDAEKGVKHDFNVHAGADPSLIQMVYNGANNLAVLNQGNTLTFTTPLGSLEEGKLFCHQNDGNEIESSYSIKESGVSFNIGDYDKNKTLIIDPPLVLNWATYYGGSSNEGGRGITNDIFGNIFVTGFVVSTNFPTFNPGASFLQAANAGGANGANGWADAFVVKFNNAGVRQWATYYGGTGDDRGEGVAADNLGNVYVVGGSSSPDMPLQNLPGAYNQALAPISGSGLHDVMILKFNNAGARLWATYYGGSDKDMGMDVNTDNAGNVYITGFAGCNNFPLTNPGGTAYFQQNYGGGACDNMQISGDAFVLKLNTANSVVWSTLLGGNGGDVGHGITIDNAGNIIVAGEAQSTNFPRLNPGAPAYYQNNNAGNGFLWGEVFITKFGPAYNMLWSTYCGGNYGDVAEDVAVDASGNIYVTGSSASTNFPIVNLAGAYNQAAQGGPNGQFAYGDAIIMKFSNAGALLWSTYYGGTSTDIGKSVIVDRCDNVYFTGHTASTGFPTHNPGASYFFDGTYNGSGYYGNPFILGFNKNCVQNWGTHYGVGGVGMHITVDMKGKVTIAGEAWGSGFALANPGAGAYYDASYNGNPNDLIVARFAPIPINLSVHSQNNVTCFGLSNGTASVSPSGGVPPYTYSWNTVPSQTTSMATGLAAGTYSVTVFDANCSIDTLSFIITQPLLLQAFTPAKNNVGCYGANTGWATATQLGGTAPYFYSWNPTAQTTATASNLFAGNYTVTITDNNNCVATSTVSITQPPLLTLSVTAQTNLLCNGNSNGTATVIGSGGTPGYTYSWNNGQTNTTASGLSALTYTATVTDNNGCTAQTTATITQPALLQASISSFDNASCYGYNNGTATATQIGGVNPYSYSWSPTGQTAAIASNLVAGTYTIVITDNNGCTAQNTVTISQPPILTASISAQTSVLCNGGNTGTATVIAGGGTPTYSYSWNNGQTTTLSTGLSATTYSITVTDLNGCSTQTTATISEPPLLQAFVPAHNNILCNGNSTGWATAGQLGGTAPYTYLWNPSGQTGSTATNLIAGTYSVLITDNNGCTATNSISITQPPVLTANISTQTNVSCNGNNNGSATVAAAGGTPGYIYSWSNGQTNATATGLWSTTYSITVTDNNNCSAQTTVTITQPLLLTANISSQTNVLCNGQSTGNATVLTSGGSPTYTYSWSNGQTTVTANNLAANTYSVTVTDNNNCSVQTTVTITQPPVLTTSISAQTNVLCFGNATGNATTITNGGTPNYTYSWNNGQSNSTATNLSANSYTITVTDNNGCTAQAAVNITEPPLLTIGLTPVNLLCNNIASGSVNANVQGGVTSYSYSWNTSATTNNISSLQAGIYSLTITDSNGCTAQANTTITEPPALTMTLSSTPDHCSSNDGTATASVQGGTGAYTYSWNPTSQVLSTATNLGAGTYTATVTDNNGCTISNTVTVTPQANDTLQLVSINPTLCSGSCDGSATLQLSNSGNGPYTYSWNTVPAQNSLTATGLCAGTYSCTVTDVNGCSDVMSVTITQPQLLSATITPTPVSCFGLNNGSASVQASGGTIQYSYSWDNGQTTSLATGIAAGIFSCTVTDNNGCTTVATTNITEPTMLIANVSLPQAICNGQNATLTSSGSGGTPAYNYSWNTGAAISAITVGPSTETNYTITITDANGCTATAITTVSVNALPDVSFSSDVVAGCGPLCVTFTNNTANTSTASWIFGDGNSGTGNPTILHCYNNPGAYSVTLTVTDLNGCVASNSTANYITVYPNPVASFSALPQPASILSPNVYFTDLSSGAFAWQWSFGDVVNSSSTVQNPNFVYSDTGVYLVQLIVVNEFGCADTVNDEIKINPDFIVYIPNTFTPNGDGLNEIFIPIGIGIASENYEFFIFDRWGDMIFKSTNPAVGWDGKANGGAFMAQQDTYVWRVNITDVFGKKHRYTGHVNLIR